MNAEPVNAYKSNNMIVLFSLLAFMAITLISSPVMGESKIIIRPMIVVGQEYDDNINLDNKNKKSDYITTISPGISIIIDSTKNGLNLEYSPTWVRYHKFDRNNTVRHNAELNFWHRFSKHLKFDLNESFLESEEPFEDAFEEDPQRQTFRHDRNTYKRNRASAGLEYQLGREDRLKIDYMHELLENEDPSLDDVTGHGPSGEFSHSFNKDNSIELSYRSSKIDYDSESGSPLNENVDGREGDVRYNHRFDPGTRAYLQYGITMRDFEGVEEDYNVHDALAGLEYSFARSTHTFLTLEAGLYEQTGTESDDRGFSFAALLSKKMRHGEMHLGVKNGWDEGFLDPEKRDFTEFWETQAGIQYDFQEDFHAFADIYYRKNNFPDNTSADTETYTGQFGLRKEFLRWYSVGLAYTYLDHRSDYPDSDFVDNRIMMTISASRPFDDWLY